MRHIYIRGMIGLIWLIAAIVCGVSGNFPMMGLYIILAGVFLYSAYTAWKNEKDGKGGRQYGTGAPDCGELKCVVQ